MDRNRRITFFAFLFLVIIYLLLQLTSCTPQRMKQPVDYSYTQDNRDSIIARVHHYEIKHKEPILNEKNKDVAAWVTFILATLIAFALQL